VRRKGGMQKNKWLSICGLLAEEKNTAKSHSITTASGKEKKRMATSRWDTGVTWGKRRKGGNKLVEGVDLGGGGLQNVFTNQKKSSLPRKGKKKKKWGVPRPDGDQGGGKRQLPNGSLSARSGGGGKIDVL